MYSHLSHRKTLLLLFTPSQKPHGRRHEGTKAAFAMICVWLPTPPPPRPSTLHEASPLLLWSMCTPSFNTLRGNMMIALPPHSRPTICPLYLIFRFSLSSAFLVSWHPDDSQWYFSFDACSNLCFFHRRNCPFPLRTVNVMWLLIVMENRKVQNNISKYFSRQSCCSGKCPVTIHIQMCLY